MIRSQKNKDETVDTYGGQQRCRKGLVGRPEAERPLGRPRRRWVFRTWDGETWTGLIWIRTEASGGLL